MTSALHPVDKGQRVNASTRPSNADISICHEALLLPHERTHNIYVRLLLAHNRGVSTSAFLQAEIIHKFKIAERIQRIV